MLPSENPFERLLQRFSRLYLSAGEFVSETCVFVFCFSFLYAQVTAAHAYCCRNDMYLFHFNGFSVLQAFEAFVVDLRVAGTETADNYAAVVFAAFYVF